RWHPPKKAAESGPQRPPASPGDPPQRADLPAPGGPVRVVRTQDDGGDPPSLETRRPHTTGATTTRVGATHGQDAQKDPRGLHRLPPGHPRATTHREIHGVVTGEPRASKDARVVRTGGRPKRACTRSVLVGAISMARAVDDPDLSEQIMTSAAAALKQCVLK